jgi:predicted lipid-binding transport protein (Tim44 family)
MTDYIGLGFFIFLIIGAILGLKILSKPRKLTANEFEKSAAEGSGMLGASMMELQKILDPAASKSVEVVQDLKGGKFDKKQAKGDGDDKTDTKTR